MDLLTTLQYTSLLRSHPMNVDLSMLLVPEIWSTIHPFILWFPGHVERKQKIGEEFFIAFLQLYSENSITWLEPSSLTFHPLNAKHLNFNKTWRREHISAGNAILAHLLASFMDTWRACVKLKELKVQEPNRCFYKLFTDQSSLFVVTSNLYPRKDSDPWPLTTRSTGVTLTLHLMSPIFPKWRTCSLSIMDSWPLFVVRDVLWERKSLTLLLTILCRILLKH